MSCTGASCSSASESKSEPSPSGSKGTAVEPPWRADSSSISSGCIARREGKTLERNPRADSVRLDTSNTRDMTRCVDPGGPTTWSTQVRRYSGCPGGGPRRRGRRVRLTPRSRATSLRARKVSGPSVGKHSRTL